MSARAPQAIYKLYADIEKNMPRATMSGIVGDAAHSFGYHLARNQLPGSDYSVQLHRDRLGASDCASALDVSLPPDLMLSVTARLHNAAKNRDPRLAALREFCGTLDGYRTYPWDLSSDSSEGVNTWDDSHLWHVHLSFYREYADNYAALAPIAEVITRHPSPSPSPPPAPDLLEWIMTLPGAPKGLTYQKLVADIADGVFNHQLTNEIGKPASFAAFVRDSHNMRLVDIQRKLAKLLAGK